MTHDGDGVDEMDPTLGEALTRCANFEEDLSALLDGELSDSREAEVRAHLDACAECAEVLLAFREIDRILVELPAPVVSEGISERLAEQSRSPAKEEAAGDSTPVSLQARHRRSSAAPWIGAAIGALAASLLFAVLWPQDEKPPVGVVEVEPGVSPPTEAELLAAELDTVEDLEMLEVLDLLEELAREEEPQTFDREARSS